MEKKFKDETHKLSKVITNEWEHGIQFQNATSIPHDGMKKVDKKLMFEDKVLKHYNTLPDSFWDTDELLTRYDIRKDSKLQGSIELVGYTDNRYDGGDKDAQFYICGFGRSLRDEKASGYFKTMKEVIAHINKYIYGEWDFCIYPDSEEGL